MSLTDFLFVQIDLKKMPLGKLTRRQIESAYSVLGEAQRVSEQLLTFEGKASGFTLERKCPLA